MNTNRNTGRRPTVTVQQRTRPIVQVLIARAVAVSAALVFATLWLTGVWTVADATGLTALIKRELATGRAPGGIFAAIGVFIVSVAGIELGNRIADEIFKRMQLGRTKALEDYVVGARSWRLRHDVRGAIRLQSLVAESIWKPGEPMRGESGKPDRGIYACRGAEDLGFLRTEVFGSVALAGRIVEHQYGYRADFAYPLRVVVRNERDARALARTYGCESMTYQEMGSILRRRGRSRFAGSYGAIVTAFKGDMFADALLETIDAKDWKNEGSAALAVAVRDLFGGELVAIDQDGLRRAAVRLDGMILDADGAWDVPRKHDGLAIAEVTDDAPLPFAGDEGFQDAMRSMLSAHLYSAIDGERGPDTMHERRNDANAAPPRAG